MSDTHISANFYLTASSKQNGALAIFHVYGEEPHLVRVLDARTGGKSNPSPMPPLSPHDLRYGWLRTEAGEVIDEVMLAAPAPGQRVLMTHGGKVIREQAEAYLEQNGFPPIFMNSKGFDEIPDPVLDKLLASCVTEGQAAAVLAAREKGAASPSTFARILTQHRVVLAGAPNAGKSSLLNALAGYDRAFVDPEAGATRDVVDELVDVAGYPVWIGDMPGYAEMKTDLDTEAWTKASQRLSLAEEIWFVVDASEEWSPAADSAARAVAELCREVEKSEGEPTGSPSVLIILNKTDRPRRLTARPWERFFPAAPAVSVSTLSEGNAVEALEEYVADAWNPTFTWIISGTIKAASRP